MHGGRDHAVRGGVGELDAGPEGLVHAVLGPGLGQRLQFGVVGGSAFAGEVVLDHPHLLDVERQDAGAAQGRELRVGQARELDGLDPEVGRGLVGERRRQLALGRPLDGVVGQQPAGQHRHVVVVEVADEVVAARRRHPDGGEPQLRCGPLQLTGVGIGHPGHGCHLDRPPARGGGGTGRVPVDDRVDQDGGTQPLDVGRVDGAVDVVHARDPARRESGDPDEGGGIDQPGAIGVVGGDHVDA